MDNVQNKNRNFQIAQAAFLGINAIFILFLSALTANPFMVVLTYPLILLGINLVVPLPPNLLLFSVLATLLTATNFLMIIATQLSSLKTGMGVALLMGSIYAAIFAALWLAGGGKVPHTESRAE